MRGDNADVVGNALLVASVAVTELVLTLRLFRSGLAFAFDANVILVVGILFAVFLWIMRMTVCGEIALCRTGVGLALAVFAAGVVASLFASTHKRPSVVLASNWLAYVGLFFYAANVFRGNRLWTVLVRALLASAVVVSLFGAYQRFFGLDEIRAIFDQDPASVIRRFHLTPDALDDFRARVHNPRVFSTFVLPNSFAAFLILVLPIQLGWLWDVSASRKRRWRIRLGVNLAGLAAMFAALFLTKSKGAWIVFALGMAGWGLVGWRRALWARHRMLMAGLALVVVLLCVAHAAGELPHPGDFLGSFTIRLDYWRGAWRLIRQNPILGVGLDCFGDNYAQFKAPEDGESQKVHNDYLQVWAEAGILGAAGLWAFCLIFARRYAVGRWPSRPQATDAPVAEDRAFICICLLMGAAAFAVQYVAFGSFVPSKSVLPRWWLTLVFFAVWTAFYIVNSACLEDIASSYRVWQGMIVGVVCVMVHSLGDFDLYVHGVAQTMWVIAGIVCALSLGRSKRLRVWQVGRAGQAVVTVVAVAVMAILVSWISPRFLRASVHEALAEKYESAGKASRAIHEWRAAQSLDPWNVNSHVRLAVLFRKLWDKRVRKHEGKSTLNLAIAEAEKATRLNPRSATHHALLGQLLLRKLPFDRSVLKRVVAEHRRATELYPSKPHYWARLGHVHELAGLRQEAATAYERALALSPLQRYPRNELTPKLRDRLKARIRVLRGGASGSDGTKRQ